MSASLLNRPIWKISAGPMNSYASMVPNGGDSSSSALALPHHVYGEVHAISPQGVISLNDGSTVSLENLMRDGCFARHIPRLGFWARDGKTAHWSEPMSAVRRALDALVPDVIGKLKEADLLQADKFEIYPHRQHAGLLSGYRDAIRALVDIGYLFEHNSLLRLHVECCTQFHALTDLMEEMSSTIPPLRAYVPPPSTPDAAALLVVTRAKKGAELFLGLDGRMRNTDIMDRVKVGGGSLYPYLHTVDARKGNLFVIPPYVPFAVGSDINYLLFTPTESDLPCIDSWQHCLRTELWEKFNSGLIDGVVERGVVRRGMLDKNDVGSERRMLIDKLSFSSAVHCAGTHYSSDALHVSLMGMPKGERSTRVMDVQGEPVAMFVLDGGMRVQAGISGSSYFFRGGDTVLFPATTAGVFTFETHEESVFYMMASVPPASRSVRHEVKGDLGEGVVVIRPFPNQR